MLPFTEAILEPTKYKSPAVKASPKSTLVQMN